MAGDHPEVVDLGRTGAILNVGGAGVMSGGNDSITNNGQMETFGALTSIDFGAGSDSLTNNGRIDVGFHPVNAAGSTLSMANLDRFANSGLINLMNGIEHDAVSAPQAAFSGSGASELAIDAYLGAPGSTADTLTVASSSGVTHVLVNDTNTGAGAYNAKGILVVQGSSGQADFVLDPQSSHYNPNLFGGSLDPGGLFAYQLAYDSATKATYLVGAPKPVVFEFAALGTAAQNVWYATSPWLNRQADMRDAFDGHVTATEGKTEPGVWAKAVGSWTNRSSDQAWSAFGVTNNIQMQYDQQTEGLVGGVDFAHTGARHGDGTFVFGGSVGYVDSTVDFAGSHTKAKMSGAVLGVYGSYIKNGLFVDASFKADLMKLTDTVPGIGFQGKANANSYGGMLDTGYRIHLSGLVSGVDLEPLATLTYVSTHIGALNVPGATVDFGDNHSLRGAIGVRLSGDLIRNDSFLMRFNITERTWDEFDGKNHATLLTSGNPNLALTDRFSGAFQELSGGLQVFGSKSGWSGFVDGDWKVKSHYSSPGVTVGFRYQW